LSSARKQGKKKAPGEKGKKKEGVSEETSLPSHPSFPGKGRGERRGKRFFNTKEKKKK